MAPGVSAVQLFDLMRSARSVYVEQVRVRFYPVGCTPDDEHDRPTFGPFESVHVVGNALIADGDPIAVYSPAAQAWFLELRFSDDERPMQGFEIVTRRR